MTPSHFQSLYREIIDENPFAVRAVLRILEVEFTSSTPTLAVTCESRPRLLVNLDFVSRHCLTETHVKAVILHEFLHVLLRHTQTLGPITRARHLAFDAVINAIICRTQGEEWASFFSSYYSKAEGLDVLLRPPEPKELKKRQRTQLGAVWDALYAGRLVADDIAEIAEQLQGQRAGRRGVPKGGDSAPGSGAPLIGNHDELGEVISPALEEALNQAMREMNGSGIWRNQPRGLAHKRTLAAALATAAASPVRQWERATLRVLRQHVQPERRRACAQEFPIDFTLPVLSPGDRRAFLKTQWSPVLPVASWSTVERRPRSATQVYLDVSGSMNTEMPYLISLLARLSGSIRRPLWAFSDVVAPARIERGALITETTGGTSLACVLRHVIETRPPAAVIITDGFIERLAPSLVKGACQSTRLHALVSRHGSPSLLQAAGLPYTQLQELPA